MCQCQCVQDLPECRPIPEWMKDRSNESRALRDLKTSMRRRWSEKFNSRCRISDDEGDIIVWAAPSGVYVLLY